MEAAYKTAQNATGSAAEENARWLESIDGHLQTLANTWQKVWVDTVSSDLVKNVIDIGNAIGQVVDALGGLDSVLAPITAMVISLNLSKIPGILSKIVAPITSLITLFKGTSATQVFSAFLGKDIVGNTKNQIKNMSDLATNTQTAAKANQMLAISEKSLAAAMALRQIAITAIIVGISLLIQYIKKQREEELALRKESIQNAKDSADAYQNALEAYKKYLDVSKNTATSEDELRNAMEGVETALGNKATHLKTLRDNTEAYNKELEHQIELEREQRRGEAVEAIANAKKTVRERQDELATTDEWKQSGLGLTPHGALWGAKAGAALNPDSLESFEPNELVKEYIQLQEEIKKAQDRLADLQHLANDDPLRKSAEEDLEALRKREKEIENEAEDLYNSYISYINSVYDPQNFAGIDSLVEDLLDQFAPDNNKEAYREMFTKIVRDTLPDATAASDAAKELTDLVNKNVENQNKNIITDQEEQYRDLYDHYKQTIEDINQLGLDAGQTVFGNVDLAARTRITWTKENLKKYDKELKSLGWDKMLEGSISTVMGDRGEFGKAGIPVAFSPMFIEADGTPVPIHGDTIRNYLDWLIDTATDDDGKVDIKLAMAIDKSGTDLFSEDGRRIQGIVAGIGDEAGNADYAMHYIDDHRNAIKDLESVADECGESVAELINKLENGVPEALSQITPEQLQEAFSIEDINLLNSDDLASYREGAKSIEDLQNALNEYKEDIGEIPNFQKDFTNALNKSKDSIDDVQKDLSSLSDIATNAFDGLSKPDEFIDGLQTVAEILKKLPNSDIKLDSVDSLKDLGKIAKQVANEELEALIKKLKEAGATDAFIANFRKSAQALMDYQQSVNTAVNGMSSLSSAYQAIRGAMDEYNKSGQMTFATLSSLLSLEPEYLAILQMENGQLGINQTALEALVEAKKADAIAATYDAEAAELSAMAEQAAAEKADASKTSHDNVVGALNNAAAAYSGLANEAVKAAKAEALAAGVKQGDIKAVDDKWAQIRKSISGITVSSRKAADKVLGYSSKAGKGAGNSAKDAADEIKKEIDDLLSKWKQAVDDGAMTYNQYLSKMKALTDKYYKDGKIKAEDYAEYQRKYYREQIDMYKAVASAAQEVLNEQKEGIQEQIDVLNKQKDALNDQIDDINDKYDALIKKQEDRIKKLEAKQDKLQNKITKYEKQQEKVREKYDPQIEANEKIIKQYEAQIRPLQAIVDEHQDIIDSLNRQIEDIERVRRVYEYQIDDIEKIKRANDRVIDDLEHEQKYYEKQQKVIEKAVSTYERQQKLNDRKIKQLEKQQKLYEKQQNALEKQIKTIEKQQKILEKTKNPYEEQIKALQKQKEELQKVNDERNRALNLQKAQYELDKAQYQRTAYVYTQGGFEYRADEEAVSSAKDNLADVQFDMQISDIDDQISAAQTAIDLITEKIDSLQKHIDELNDKIDELQDPIDAIQDVIDVWNDKNDELEWNIEQLNWKIEDLQVPIDNLQDIIDGLNDANDEWDYKIAKIQIHIDALDDSIEELNRQIKIQEDIMAPYQRQIEDINKEISKLEEANKLLKEAEEDEIETIQKKIDKIQKEIDKYDEKIKKINKIIDKYEEERDKMVAAIEDQIKALDKQTKALDEQIETLDKYSKEWDKVAKTFEKMKNEKLLEDIFGPNWKDFILNGDHGAFEKVRNGIVEAADALNKLGPAGDEASIGLDKAGDSADSAGGAAADAAPKFDDLSNSLGEHVDIKGHYEEGLTRSDSNSNGRTTGSGKGLNGKLSVTQQNLQTTMQNAGLASNKYQEVTTKADTVTKSAEKLNGALDNSGQTATITKTKFEDTAKTAGKSAEAVSSGSKAISASSKAISSSVSKMTESVDKNFRSVQGYAEKTKQIVRISVNSIDQSTQKLKTSEKLLESINKQAGKVKQEVSRALTEISKKSSSTENEVKKALSRLKAAIENGRKNTKTNVDQVKKLTSLTGQGGLGPAVKSIKDFISKYVKAELIKKSEEAKTKVTDTFSHSKGLRNAINSIKQFISQHLKKLQTESQTTRDLIKKHWEGAALNAAKQKINELLNQLNNLAQASQNAKKGLDDVNSTDLKDVEKKIKECEKLKKAAENATKALEKLNETEIKEKEIPPSGGSGTTQTKANGGRVDKFASGGRVKKYNISGILNNIAQSVGEDTMVAVKDGEGIFTERQTNDLEEFIKLTPELVKSTKALSKFSKLFTGLNTTSANASFTQNQISTGLGLVGGSGGIISTAPMTNSNNVTLSIGDIHLNGVQNVDVLAQDIKNNLPNTLLQVLTRR